MTNSTSVSPARRRRTYPSLLTVLLAAAAGVWAATHLSVGSSDIHQWLPASRPERLRYEKFLQQFGSDQVVLISWPGCQLTDPRLGQFALEVESDAHFDRWFSGLETTDRVLNQLTSRPLRLSPRQAARRLRGILLGEDGSSLVLARVSPLGVAQPQQALSVLQRAAHRVPGLEPEELRIVGAIAESAAIDAAAARSFQQLVWPSTGLALLVTWGCLRRLRAALLVLTLAGLGQLLAISLVYYSGATFGAVLIVLPTLIFILTLAGAIHLTNYYDELPPREDRYLQGAAAVAIGWRPCWLSSLTTLFGMGSLILSQLWPVQQFGIFAALGLGLATGLLMLVFPAAAEVALPKRWPNRRPRRLRLGPLDSRRLQTWVNRQSASANWIALASLGLLAATLAGLPFLKSSTNVCEMFPADHRTSRDMRWFEKHVCPIASLEVLLQFDSRFDGSILDQAALVRAIANRLARQDSVGGVLSAVAFLPEWDDTQSARGLATRTLIRERLTESLADLQKAGLVQHDSSQSTWRIMCKISAVQTDGYSELLQTLAQLVSAELNRSESTESVQFELTGWSPLVRETQETLLTDLPNSFLMAFLLITPIMMWIAGSLTGGLLLMIPNVLPISLVFGICGWVGWSLDIAGILTASIALGIAVDDTLHFVNWYRLELAAGQPRSAAILRTFKSCAPAMCQTTWIACTTMVPFLFADFVPTQRFAGLMIAMLTAALAADLLILPGLLLSSPGNCISAARTGTPPQSDSTF